MALGFEHYNFGKEKFTFFWRGVFSQWYPSNFTAGGIQYCCCEQFMMAEKARLFGDQETEAAILNTLISKEQKSLGRLVKGFDKAKWEAIQESGKPYCWDVVYVGNYHKFSQNSVLKEELMKTAGTTLVEASPYDTIWGIGLGEENPDALDRSKWKGLNWLGEVLTQLREDFSKIIVPNSFCHC